MPRAFRGVLPAIVTALLLAAPLAAQTNTGSVYGNVIDEQNMPIPGGTATLIGSAAPRTAPVDSGGLFRFLKVAPGKYAVTVTMPGFTTVTRENVIVSVGNNSQVELQLKLSNVQEAVTVTSATPLIDTRKVETGQTFQRDELTQIPTSRDIWSLIQQVPGVQIDSVNVAGNQSALVGGPDLISKGSGNVSYQVDGATITDNTYGNPFSRQNGGTNTYFDFSTFENVEVSTGGSLLDQQTSGVTINVVTKRGTNEIRGSARYLYASGNWQSNNTPQEAIDQGVQTNSTRYIREYGADIGGPIVKDKVWLWAAGSYQTINLNAATFSSTLGSFSYPDTTNLKPFSAKLNAQVSNANALALYYSRSDRIEDGAGAAPNRPIETRTDLIIPTNFFKIEDSHVFSSDLFGSLFVSYQDPNYTSTPIGGLTNDIQYYNDSYHNSYFYYLAKDHQRQANVQMSKFFNTGSINHEIKVNFNYRQQIADSATGLPGTQNQGNEYSSSSYNYALLSRGVRTIFKSQFLSGTIGDTLTTGNLTVTAGVRWDRQQAKNLPSTSFANPLFANPCTGCGLDGGDFPGLPEVQYHGSSGWQFQYDNWQPRIAATYGVGEKKSTLLRASYARFADQLGFIGYYGSGVPISNGYYYYWTDLNHDHNVTPNEVLFNHPYGVYNGIDPAVLPNNPNQIAPNYKTPSTTEWTAGVDQQLTDTFAVSATFSYRNTTNLQEANATGSSLSTYDSLGRTLCDGIPCQAVAPNGLTININEPFYGLNLDSIPPGVTLDNRPGATQRYYGVDFSVVKRMSDNWSLRGNFGWNSFRQYLTAQSISDPNNLWALGGQNDNGALAPGYTGKYAVINGSWQFNVNGLYQAPYGIALGVNFFGRQGYPNPYYVRAYTQDVADNIVNILIDNVDTYRYQNVYQLDLRLSKTFQIGPVAVVPAVELFNATNNAAVLQRYERTGTYNRRGCACFDQNTFFNQIIEVQSPRIVRLGLTVNF
jgi:Carboxypeptidase regulatory-like domain/TonB-dependent Receptor Plug Domain